MALKDVLEKMKLVEAEEDEAPRPPVPSSPPPPPGARPRVPPPPPTGRAPNMADVLHKVPPPVKIDEQILPKSEGDEIPDFDAVYLASGVKQPAHGFTAYKVLEILSSADFAALDARAKAAALGGFLRMNPSGPVNIADVIQDAVARDQALDNFEQFLSKKLDGKREQLDKEDASLQAEIDALVKKNQEKMETNRQLLEKEKQRLAEWQAKKRIEERKLFDAVGPFVEQNPVSLGSAPEAPATPSPRPTRG